VLPEPRTAIATVCLSGTLEDKLAAAGFDGVELFENDLLVSPSGPAEIRKRCAGLGLSIDLYQPFRVVMAELGTDTVLVCSSVSPHAMDDDELAAEQRGMRIAYEALAWGRHVSGYEHA
jgi:4-hydroxyphenylpyruvate dioxygenase